MHNPKSVLENETHKLLWDFEIQTNNIISERPPNLVINNKKKEKEEKMPNSILCRHEKKVIISRDGSVKGTHTQSISLRSLSSKNLRTDRQVNFLCRLH